MINGSLRLMGYTGVDVSIIVGCRSKQRGWGVIMGIGDIVRSCLVGEYWGWMIAVKMGLIMSTFARGCMGTNRKW
jgi:hypothetical protein